MTEIQFTQIKICPLNEIMPSAAKSPYLCGFTNFFSKKGDWVWLASISELSKEAFDLLKTSEHQSEFTVIEFENKIFQIGNFSGFFQKENFKVVFSVKKVIEEKVYSRQVTIKEEDRIQFKGENLFIDYSWEVGGRSGGKNFDTYRGFAIIDGKKYIVYAHWSYTGPLGIYDETNTYLLGELSTIEKEGEWKTVVSFFKFVANA